MTTIYTQQFTADPLTFEANGGSLLIDGEDGRMAHIAGLPPHVAAHTAAAFNRAMQAVPDGDGWTYQGKTGLWRISLDPAMRRVYLAQHDEVTGDGDPAWMFADAPSLIACMDEIDAQEAEWLADEPEDAA